MSRDRLSHIHYEMHMLMFPQVVTFDCKQTLQQLMISESLMGKYHEGVAASGRTLIFSVMTENNGMSERNNKWNAQGVPQ